MYLHTYVCTYVYRIAQLFGFSPLTVTRYSLSPINAREAQKITFYKLKYIHTIEWYSRDSFKAAPWNRVTYLDSMLPFFFFVSSAASQDVNKLWGFPRNVLFFLFLALISEWHQKQLRENFAAEGGGGKFRGAVLHAHMHLKVYSCNT